MAVAACLLEELRLLSVRRQRRARLCHGVIRAVPVLSIDGMCLLQISRRRRRHAALLVRVLTTGQGGLTLRMAVVKRF